MSRHIKTLLSELHRLRADCPQSFDTFLGDQTRGYFQSNVQGQNPRRSLAVVLYELLGHLEYLARVNDLVLPPPSADRPTSWPLHEACPEITYHQVATSMHGMSNVHPIDVLAVIATSTVEAWTANPPQVPSQLTNNPPVAPSPPPTATAFPGTQAQWYAPGAAAQVPPPATYVTGVEPHWNANTAQTGSGFANTFASAPHPPAPASAYPGTQAQGYGYGAVAQVPPPAPLATGMAPHWNANTAQTVPRFATIVGAPHPPAPASAYPGTQAQVYVPGVEPRSQPHVSVPQFSGHVNTQAPRDPGGMASLGLYDGQDLRPAADWTQPTQPGNLVLAQAPQVSGRENLNRMARALPEAVRIEISPSSWKPRRGKDPRSPYSSPSGGGFVLPSVGPRSPFDPAQLKHSSRHLQRQISPGDLSEPEMEVRSVSSLSFVFEGEPSDEEGPAEAPRALSQKQVFDTYATRHIKSSPDEIWPDNMASNLKITKQIHCHHRMWLEYWRHPGVSSYFMDLADMSVPMPAGFEYLNDLHPFLYMLYKRAFRVFIRPLANGARLGTREGWNTKALQVVFDKTFEKRSTKDGLLLSERTVWVREVYVAYLILLEYRAYMIDLRSARTFGEFIEDRGAASYRNWSMFAIMERIRCALNAAEQGLATNWAASTVVAGSPPPRPSGKDDGKARPR